MRRCAADLSLRWSDMRSCWKYCALCGVCSGSTLITQICLSEYLLYFRNLSESRSVLGVLFYCPFDTTWKDICLLSVLSKRKYFVLIDHILSETVCLFFCFCVSFSNIYPKIKLTAKNWSGLRSFYRKVIV